MPIQTIETRRLYRKIADQIAALIQAGEFTAGTRLPPERELAQQLGVSRPSVREALIALEIAGLVDVRTGSGIYVCSIEKAAGFGPDDIAEPGPFELVAARRLIEGENCALAAQAASEADLDRIAETIEMMEKEFQATSRGFEADRLFHLRIAEATGNSALAHVVHNLWELRRGPMYQKFENHFDTLERHAQAIDEHGLILSALRKRDPQAARAAMHAHLDAVRQAFALTLDDGAPEAPSTVSELPRHRTVAKRSAV
jgi:DNA-binding FadR family transcriptional regulator